MRFYHFEQNWPQDVVVLIATSPQHLVVKNAKTKLAKVLNQRSGCLSSLLGYLRANLETKSRHYHYSLLNAEQRQAVAFYLHHLPAVLDLDDWSQERITALWQEYWHDFL